MDQIFFFIIEIVPTSATPRSADIAGAIAQIFVSASSREEAEKKARAYLMGYAWIVKKVEYVSDIWSGRFPPEDKPILEERIAEARAAGLSVTIGGWPKAPRSTNSVEVRIMGPPLDGGGCSS